MPGNREHVDENMVKMEVNLDDMPGEWLGHVMDLLFDAGANDVFYIPIYMKKNRPGVMLQLLCHQEDLERMERILFTETTTLGIRYVPTTVHRLERRFYKVNTEWGEVTVKEGRLKGKVVQRSPEFEDCRAIAEKHGVPLKYVYHAVWKRL
ncbi:MAG TPA: nickel insertion protein [Bacillales bacterium]|nr:nickel insertion protein [Bacillales bacterium]